MDTKKVELLAPAKNLACGLAAINHGADAVYIGAKQFGARYSAGNSVEDIAKLVEYAHLYNVKVYVALNTIIEENELLEAEKLIVQLYEVGVDALIIQDLGILKMNIPPIMLHASTQADVRDADKVAFLEKKGFSRVVLARELSLQQISEIHNKVPTVEIEVFVHGALCVSYSGQCYASQYCFGRSANKGVCAQFCRLAFDLVDNEGNVLFRDKHLLSLKDMNRSNHIEELLDAGVTSFKIEGRLKDESYVKNVTAFYRAEIDKVLECRKEYVRSSFGRSTPQFVPVLEKSFNRGFTNYFLKGDKDDITSFDTPKSIGEPVGYVKNIEGKSFSIKGKKINNGDGLCFIGKDEKLYGYRINKVEGDKIFPQLMPRLFCGVKLFRNHDNVFEKQVEYSNTQRKLSLSLEFYDNNGFVLKGSDESGIEAMVDVNVDKEEARVSGRDNIIKQLNKWGNTSFEVSSVNLKISKEWFVPSSLLSDMRRRLCYALLEKHKMSYMQEKRCMQSVKHRNYITTELDYRANVSNSLALSFYKENGVDVVTPAYELQPVKGVPVMFCKHCIKKYFGWCKKEGSNVFVKEPLYLKMGDGRHFRLAFDCAECMMKVIPIEADY